jgi:O-antigen/teichoic acid export membrane protein
MGGFLGAFTLTGMATVIVRAVSQGFDGTFKSSLPIQFAWVSGMVVLTLAVSTYYFIQGNNEYGIAFLVLALFAPLSAVLYTYSSYLKGRQQFRLFAIRNVLTESVYFIVLASTIFFLPEPVFLVAGYYVSRSFMYAFFCVRTLRANPPKQPGIRKEDVSYAKHLSLMKVVAIAANYSEHLIVYHLLGPVQLAIYSFAVIMPDRVRAMFNVIAGAALPKLSANTHGTRESYMRKVMQLSLVAMILIVGYVVLAPFVFSWFFPQYMESLWYSQLYALVLFALPVQLAMPTLQAARRERELVVLSVILPIVRVVGAFFSIYWFGVSGAIILAICYLWTHALLATYFGRAAKL